MSRLKNIVQLRIPDAPRSITKGSSLNSLLDHEAIDCLANNITMVFPTFDNTSFIRSARENLQPLALIERGRHVAKALRKYLPQRYENAIHILLQSLTPPLAQTEGNGLGVFFYLPHVCFVATYGLDQEHNANHDPFEISMNAQYELTRRFSAEFSIRPFLIHWPKRTLDRLMEWTKDKDPHVRRLCSEGTRPRLPWAKRIPSFMRDPRPTLLILEALKDDPALYVARSVANHLGDLAKDHLDLALAVCERWLEAASSQRKWVIRHALRHPAKKGVKKALQLCQQATYKDTNR